LIGRNHIRFGIRSRELELQVEVEAGDQDKIEAEFGDVLFSMINYARFLNVNPEDALERTNKKFIKRFQYLESKAGDLGKPLMDMTLQKWIFFGKKRRSYSFQFYSNQCSDFSLDISGLVSFLNN
jgi:hypothetical protein